MTNTMRYRFPLTLLFLTIRISSLGSAITFPHFSHLTSSSIMSYRLKNQIEKTAILTFNFNKLQFYSLKPII